MASYLLTKINNDVPDDVPTQNLSQLYIFMKSIGIGYTNDIIDGVDSFYQKFQQCGARRPIVCVIIFSDTRKHLRPLRTRTAQITHGNIMQGLVYHLFSASVEKPQRILY